MPTDPKLQSLMDEFFETHHFVGEIAPWMDVPETGEAEDEPNEGPRVLGGQGSGNFGHAGRPGEVGGSAPDSESSGGGKEGKKISVGGRGKPERAFGEKADKLAENLTHGTKSQEIHALSVSDEDINITGVTGGREDFKLNLTAGDEYLYVNLLETSPELRTTDTAITLVGNTLNLAAQHGAEGVEFNANLDKGGYAWARMGAVSAEPERLAADVLTRVGQVTGEESINLGGIHDRDTMQAHLESIAALKELNLSKDEVTQLRDFIAANKNSQDLPARLAELKLRGNAIGRHLLRGISWHGKFNVKDEKAMARFHRFTRKAA